MEAKDFSEQFIKELTDSFDFFDKKALDEINIQYLFENLTNYDGTYRPGIFMVYSNAMDDLWDCMDAAIDWEVAFMKRNNITFKNSRVTPEPVIMKEISRISDLVKNMIDDPDQFAAYIYYYYGGDTENLTSEQLESALELDTPLGELYNRVL